MTAQASRHSSSKAQNAEPRKPTTTPHTRMQIRIIQAIDRKAALDDFAESENISVSDLLSELEALVQIKTHLDLSYFTDEVLGPESMEEILDYYAKNGDESIEKAQEEFADFYRPEELRLARVVFRCQQNRKK